MLNCSRSLLIIDCFRTTPLPQS
uniref:Uncharacterized protein n=1 Tax=Rhizophora mucronata TaxID=61149 RepID=A0A2P2NP51_RHIMU